ncbi:hypothetical protein, partial [Latilactobacillus sakei]|uniref:hypothetical protein n=1 Tax=Latilactobacillus sakei TaxID=1599 RepID=UPI003F532C15
SRQTTADSSYPPSYANAQSQTVSNTLFFKRALSGILLQLATPRKQSTASLIHVPRLSRYNITT